MQVDATHPEYQKRIDDWSRVRDCVEGESAIRRSILRYLPPPPGLEPLEGVTGERYDFYATFAEFPEIISPTLNGILGLIHEKPPVVELPSDMEYLIAMAAPEGLTLQELWEKQTKELLVVGRISLLAEVYDNKLYLCPYSAETLINWHLQLPRDGGKADFVCLKERVQTFSQDDPFSQEETFQYRVLQLIDGVYRVTVYIENPDEKDREDNPFVILPQDGDAYVEPNLRGQIFEELPMVVSNVLDTGFDYGPIPMLPLARRACSIFRKTADYNRSLYIKGDPQPVIFGIGEEDVPSQIGGGEIWTFANSEGKAEYLDIDGQGIPLQRQSIDDEFRRFADEVGTLFEGSSTGYESGEALRRRQAMRQATMKSLVLNAAQGMQEALQMIARNMGKSDSQVAGIKFVPNVDFTEPMMAGQELRDVIEAKRLGAPISMESLHALMKRRQITEMEFQKEMSLLLSEPQLEPVKPKEPVAESNTKAKPQS